MSKRWKSWKLGLPVGAAVLLLAACGVSNPGTFTTTVLSGSSLVLTDEGGTPTLQFAVGAAPCSDGRDNDLDARIDSGSDHSATAPTTPTSASTACRPTCRPRG